MHQRNGVLRMSTCRDIDIPNASYDSAEWPKEKKKSLRTYTDESENQRLHAALRTLLKKCDARFTCQAQKDAVVEALRREDDLVICMGTGRGKSLIFQLSAHIEKDRGLLTIVVVPLVALSEDHIRRCKDLQISVERWEQRDLYDYQILFVSVEDVGTDEFRKFLNNNCEAKKVPRIVSDECHLSSVWSAFRPAMRRLASNLYHPTYPIQRILLSATIPPSLTEEIARNHGLLLGYREIRESTARFNLSYNVLCQEQNKIQSPEQAVLHGTAAAVLNELTHIAQIAKTSNFTARDGLDTEIVSFAKQQVVIYVPFRNMVPSVAAALRSTVFGDPGAITSKGTDQTQSEVLLHRIRLPGAPNVLFAVDQPLIYHSAMDPANKSRNQKRWNWTLEKTSAMFKKANILEPQEHGVSQHVVYIQIMIATSAFGTVVDSTHIRTVLHVGFYRSMLEYTQESGGAGRDDEEARCIIVYNERFAR